MLSPHIEHKSEYCDSTQHSTHLNYIHFGPRIVTKVLEMFRSLYDEVSDRNTKNLKQNITNAETKELATVLAFFEVKKKRIISFILL